MKKLILGIIAASALVLAGCSDSDSSSDTGSAASSTAGDIANQIGSAASNAADAVGSGARTAQDTAFVSSLSVGDLKFGSDDEVVDEAKDVCSDLKDGKSATDAGNDVKEKYNGDDGKARNFVRASVAIYCPTEVGKLIY